MGFYIGYPQDGDKVKLITEEYGGIILSEPPKPENFPSSQAIICVVDNGSWEAAAFCYKVEELQIFLDDTSERPKVWILMDRQKACELSGFED